jgi:methyl-accepting chemotaxis protein/hemerythrin
MKKLDFMEEPMNEFIVWSDAYKVNVGLLDGQHKIFMNKINELYNAVRCNNEREGIENFLKKLVFYTLSHFEAEEELMRKHGYPEYEAHKIIHKALTREVHEFQRKFQSGEADVIDELMEFLKKWLVDHIMVIDKKYSAFLNKKGVV